MPWGHRRRLTINAKQSSMKYEHENNKAARYNAERRFDRSYTNELCLGRRNIRSTDAILQLCCVKENVWHAQSNDFRV